MSVSSQSFSMPSEEYFNRPEISNSNIKEFLTGEEDIDEATKRRFLEGSALHYFILEPHLFESHLLLFEASERQKIRDDIEKMALKVKNDLLVKAIFEHPEGKAEQVYIGQLLESDENDFSVKNRIKTDFTIPGELYLELKSTSATNFKSFLYQALKFDYDRQIAMGIDLGNFKKAVIVGVTKTLKNPRVFKIPVVKDDDFYLRGKEKYREAITKIIQERWVPKQART